MAKYYTTKYSLHHSLVDENKYVKKNVAVERKSLAIFVYDLL